MIPPFSIAKCKTKAAFSAKLQNPVNLNLRRIKEKCETIIDTPILLVIKEHGIEIIVHGYGELLFKNCTDTALMEKIARKVYEEGLK